MSEGYVEFSKIVSARISEDGKEIQLVCRGEDGGEFDMLVPAKAVSNLIHQLSTALRGALIRQHNPEPLPVQLPRFVDAPAVFIATGLSSVILPESGEINLQIKTANEADFVVSFVPEMSKQLFEFLLQVYNPDGGPN